MLIRANHIHITVVIVVIISIGFYLCGYNCFIFIYIQVVSEQKVHFCHFVKITFKEFI